MLRKSRRADSLPAPVMKSHRQLLCQELVELDPPPGQLQLGDQIGRQGIRERHFVERLLDQLAQQRLCESGGSRVDGSERLRQRLAAAHYAIARMNHLGAEE